MKVNTQVRNLKRNLVVQIEPINYVPDIKFLNEKWINVIDRIRELLEKGNSDMCYQELYQNINDLILFEIALPVVQTIEDVFLQHSKNSYKHLQDFLTYSNEDFFKFFNIFWKHITYNFVLLKKILGKFEKKFFSFTNSSSNNKTNNNVNNTTKND